MTTKKTQGFSYEDLGIFIGLTTFNINRNLPDFYDDEIATIFQQYWYELRKNLNASWKINHGDKHENKFNELIDSYYDPRPYYIFGKFDLAFISIIDDFEICGRSLRPFSGFKEYAQSSRVTKKANPSQPFDFKIIAGAIPKVGLGQSILKKSKEGFLRKKERYPFIAISTLKVNNFLLLKEGYTRINQLFLNYFFSELEVIKNETHCQLIETFGSFEYSLILLSNSYDKITFFLLKLRSLRFKDISGEIENIPEDFANQNIFEFTNSTYGFDYELFVYNLKRKQYNNFDFKSKLFIQPIEDEKISLNTRWFIKPGYIRDFSEGNEIENDSIRISLGLGDVFTTTRDYISITDAFTSLLKKYRDYFYDNKFLQSTLESRSLPVKKYNKKELNSILGEYSKELNVDLFEIYKSRWLIDSNKIKEIAEQLRKMGVAKIIRNKVVKIISNYNTISSNPLMFIYFLDLTPFLKSTFPKSIENYQYRLDKKTSEIHEINQIIREGFLVLENAYNNRFFQSSISAEITDFNSEYFGGIQQTISAYDAVYKTYNEIFEGNYSSNFLIVNSTPRIESSKYNLQINYFHVFQPEIFAAVCSHEALNFFFDTIPTYFFDNFNDLEVKEVIKEGYNSLRDFGFKLDNLKASEPNEEFDEINLTKKLVKFFKKQNGSFLHIDFIIKYLNPKYRLLKYLAKDIINLKFGYCDDKILFSKWHWNYFLQMPTNFKDNDNVREEQFCLLMIRLVFALSEVSIEEDKSLRFRNFYVGMVKAPYPILESAWKDNFGHVQWMIKTMLEAKEIKNLNTDEFQFNNINKYRESLINFGKKITIYAVKKDYSFSNKIKYDEVKNSIVKKSVEYTDMLINGKVVPLKEEDKINFYPTVTALIYCILKLYSDKFWNEGDAVLYRDEGLPKIKNDSDYGFTGVVMDKQGGLFSSSVTTRRELYKIRMTFIKTLWDFSLHKKYQYFMDSSN